MTTTISEYSGYIHNLPVFLHIIESLAYTRNLHVVACLTGNLGGALDFAPHVTIKIALSDIN